MTLLERRIVSLAASLALHAALLAAIVMLPPLQPSLTTTTGRSVVAVAYIPGRSGPSAAEIIEEGHASPGGSLPAESVRVSGLTLDVAKIRARQDELFPFLAGPLSAIDELREIVAARAPQMTWSTRAPTKRRSGLPPLMLTNDDLVHLVDGAWSRRERWANFAEIARLVTRHDPDEGDAPELVREHIDQNLLQPYFDGDSRDGRFWVMLNLAADHAVMLRFVSEFVREHPASRTSTELLFLLDEYAQASRDALLMLMSTVPDAALTLTRSADPAVFALAVALRERYQARLSDRGIEASAGIRRHYDDVRLRILRTIVETTPAGYGAADARFLIGHIMWDQNRVSDAMRWWRDIAPDGRGMYERIYRDVLVEVRAPKPSSAAAISAMLGVEYRRWLDFSRRRLSEFGFALDTF